NFMSYKNASIPLEPGLNLIVGPNGAGKSSILLGISVVLGQAYTERSRKLSELIRWGEDQARVSVLLDNESEKGPRPFPQARSDKPTTGRHTMSSVIEGTRETYLHWQREYEKYETKKMMEQQLKDLQRELTWRRILRKESSQRRLQDRITSLQEKSEDAEEELDSAQKEHLKLSSEVDRVNQELETFREEHLKLEHSRGFRSGSLEWIARFRNLVTPGAEQNEQLRQTIAEM